MATLTIFKVTTNLQNEFWGETTERGRASARERERERERERKSESESETLMPCVTNLVYEHLGEDNLLVLRLISSLIRVFLLNYNILKSEPLWMRVICQRIIFFSSAFAFFILPP